VRKPDESYHDWLRRQDQRLLPLTLVHFMLGDLAAEKSRGAVDRVSFGRTEREVAKRFR
jgi:hypothetical protein